MSSEPDIHLTAVQNARYALEDALTDASGVEAPETLAQSHYLLWELCLSCGDPGAAMEHLRRAIALHPVKFGSVVPPDTQAILALAVPGDFQANVPLGRLLGAACAVHILWVTHETLLRIELGTLELPPVTATMVVISEAAGHLSAIGMADQIAQFLGLPTFNRGELIARTSRVSVADTLRDITCLVVPPCVLFDNRQQPASHLFPALVRPQQSHAGRGLFLCASPTEFAASVGSPDDDGESGASYVTRFIDYRSRDGLYRKYRVVFVDGEPYPVHLAIHDRWAIWYYNARMENFPDRRDEEARFLGDIDAYLGPEAMTALRHIASRIGLEYFGLDFGQLDDGRLVLFEVETGMLVHADDPPGIFPYKAAAICRIRDAFVAMLSARYSPRPRATVEIGESTLSCSHGAGSAGCGPLVSMRTT